MVKRFFGFLIAGALLIGFGYLFYLNPSSVEFRWSSQSAFRLPIPLLLLLAFLAGAALIFLLALLRETQWTLAERRRRRRERTLERQRSTLAAGRKLQWEGLPEQARHLVRRSRQAPDTVEASILLAEAALESDRLDEARHVTEGALAHHPDEPQLLALLAAIHRRSGQEALATSQLEKAVALEPRSPRLLGTLRDSYIDQGRWTDALRAEESLLAALRFPEQILHEQPRIRGLRYQAAISSDGGSSVIEDLRGVFAQYPSFLPAAISLGDALRRSGRDREALRIWVRTARRRPLPILLERIEQGYLALNRPKRVLGLYRRLRRQGDSASLRLRHARFLLSQSAVEEAARELETAPPELEQVAGFHALWAEIHQQRGDIRPAFEALRRTLVCSPLPVYTCCECARHEPEWLERCSGCGTWDSLEVLDRTVAEPRRQ